MNTFKVAYFILYGQYFLESAQIVSTPIKVPQIFAFDYIHWTRYHKSSKVRIKTMVFIEVYDIPD